MHYAETVEDYVADDEICHECKKPLKGGIDGDDFMGIYDDVNDLEPSFHICKECLNKEYQQVLGDK